MNTTNEKSQNLVETFASNASYKTFGKALASTGMNETLRGAGPFTVFAPTDAAFESLPEGKLDSLFKPENKEELATILAYHVINGRKTVADLGKWQHAKTLGGASAPVALVGTQVSIDGAQITQADLNSSNGVIHGIDKVNMPAVTPTKQ